MRLLGVLIGSIAFSVNAADIEVFYSSLSGHSVTNEQVGGHTVQYHDLDAGRIAQSLINEKVAGTKAEAMRRFSSLQNSHEGKDLVSKVADGYQSVGRAFQLGLTRLPAIVFNGTDVVYGTTDVRAGLQEYVSREN